MNLSYIKKYLILFSLMILIFSSSDFHNNLIDEITRFEEELNFYKDKQNTCFNLRYSLQTRMYELQALIDTEISESQNSDPDLDAIMSRMHYVTQIKNELVNVESDLSKNESNLIDISSKIFGYPTYLSKNSKWA